MTTRRMTIWLVLLIGGAVRAAGDLPSTQPAPDDAQRDLAKKLIRGGGSTGETDIMTQIVGLMDSACDRLKKSFDPGVETQSVQQEIIKQLDAAIATAKRQRTPRGSGNAPGEKRSGDAAASQPVEKTGTAAGPASGGKTTASAPSAAPKVTGDFRETRRTWGNLPSRDREEMTQGVREDALPRFRALIERYYQALAESEADDHDR